MNQATIRSNRRKLVVLAIIVLLCAVGYMFYGVNFGNAKLFRYSMKLRSPKLAVMLITAFAIAGASLVFQTIIGNVIVTPCLLGMNAMYSLIHTAVVFAAGSTSLFATNSNLAFAVDLVLMGVVATVVYGWLFQKTHHNVLYILLIGTVLTSLFSSIQTTMTRIMDPNEYDSLLETLVASFENVNAEVIVASLAVLAAVIFALRKDLALLDVISLGKAQAINLGVDYQNGNMVILDNPGDWYLAEGGITSLGVMLEDLESALLKRANAPLVRDPRRGRFFDFSREND